jgi:cell division protein FtsL
MKDLFRRKRSRAVPNLIFLALGGSILTLAFLSLWQRNQMIYIGYEIEQLKEEKGALLRVQKELLVEAESLAAMERIERIAVEQLQMIPSAFQQRVYVNTEGSLTASDPAEGRIKKAAARPPARKFQTTDHSRSISTE